jgi:hypothetical protein
MQTSWPKKTRLPAPKTKSTSGRTEDNNQKIVATLDITTFSWDYDGFFQRIPTSLTVRHNGAPGDARPIQDLEAYPLQYAEPGTREALTIRGRKFWNCRHRQYVSYVGWDFSRTEHCVSSKCKLALQRAWLTPSSSAEGCKVYD